MKLSIVIVSYNVRHYLDQCLESVLRATRDIDSEIFVVDNDSKDDTVAYLKQRYAQQIKLIESNRNLGFARANNIAIKQSVGEYVLLLNPDTFVAENALTKVIDFLDAHPQAGGAGVMMHNADGSIARESRRAVPTPYVSFMKMIGRSDRYYMSHLPWDSPARIEVLSGAFCMLRRQALNKAGLLDEDFFMYGEDIDLSYRIMKSGYENWYIPAHIVHYKGESTCKTSYRYVHVFYQAMIIFFRKHYGHLSFFITAPIKMAIYLRAFIALCQMLYWSMRNALGFTTHRKTEPNYLFVGSTEMLEECRVLAERKGLQAAFYPQLEAVPEMQNSYVVYDIDTIGFEHIIAHAHQHQPGWLGIGTYNMKTHELITLRDIIA
ncbi:glycosyltransferase family 2 protein [Xylanibacter brevis]|uniref:glycosyltransferase family 2 protein n=1 Tax=Xylanibacter brevis TaxID=83231 RepID=UPI000486FBC1|nr:glycosyltransferase family 2 protein [Xylanibacter brevis]